MITIYSTINTTNVYILKLIEYVSLLNVSSHGWLLAL